MARQQRPRGPPTRSAASSRASSPLNQRRLANFNANRRGFWSLWIFLVLFLLSMVAELIANDRPILVRYDGRFYLPIAQSYPETAFGGEFETEADYRDAFVAEKIEAKGWMVWPQIGRAHV